ncbi:1,4-alpha-glucan branching protein GlgB [Hellea sp.]|nr:1,4-alpha-glucan branching protein GlgB [Hellea sp.]
MEQPEINRLISGTHADPFSRLGLHDDGQQSVIRTFAPHAETVEVFTPRAKKAVAELTRIHDAGLFEGALPTSKIKSGYQLQAKYGETSHRFDDPYRFLPSLGDLDLYLLSEGSHVHAYRMLGAHIMEQDGVQGTRFTLWAPNAAGVCVAGDFNHWSTVKNPMRSRGGSGIWELFMPDVKDGTAYKYAIRDAGGQMQPLKADPFGFGSEMRPKSASVVRDLSAYKWRDKKWLKTRHERHHRAAPMSVYEVHLGSWQQHEDGSFLTYAELADRLIPYVKELGFTHIELMPITEHPFDGSWGYQPIGLYAPTARFGTADDFKAFVDAFHKAEIGIILDWVPGHFPSDKHGLAKFDGSHLYEHADVRKGFHPDWNTLIFNFGRREVVNYLVANARFWLEEYHLDGLRVDAVASMLYLDYSREADEWIPNPDGSNQNWEAVKFLQSMNADAYSAGEAMGGGVFTVAEESTAWPGVTAPTDHDGLGFGFKWNMGWMNDTLEYMGEDPVNRSHHHHKMTFGIDYAFSENYVLPLSHDEVVHGKGSLLDRMPGDRWQKHANLRSYFGFMWGHPGKKLLFMGCEFAQSQEWKADYSLDWHLLQYPEHKNTQTLIGDLNRMYSGIPALYEQDCERAGFEWVDGGAQADNVLSFLRWDKARKAPVLVVCNFSPVARTPYRIGVPLAGRWDERLNTDSELYGGSGAGNLGGMSSEPIASHGQAHSLSMILPPLSALFFHYDGA